MDGATEILTCAIHMCVLVRAPWKEMGTDDGRERRRSSVTGHIG